MSRKRNSKLVARIIIGEKEKSYYERNRTYRCTECSHSTFHEKTIPLSDLKLEADGNVVVYEIHCENCSQPDTPILEGILDKVQPTCYSGNMENSGRARCSTCKYSRKVIVQGESVRGCNVSKVLYRCTNGKRMEHFTKGTLMSGYISCSEYES